MHVHLDQAGESAGPLLVSYGVTSVRDVGSPFSAVSRWNQRVDAGALVAPRIHAAGVIFESPRFMRLVDRLGRMLPPAETTLLADIMLRRVAISDAAGIARELALAKAQGATFVKVRNVQSPELLYAFGANARRAGLPLAAHVIAGVDLAKASENGVRSFEHYEGFGSDDVASASPAQRLAVVTAFRENRTALVPTLVTRESQKASTGVAMKIPADPRQIAAMRLAGVSADALDLWRMKLDLSRLDPALDWSHAWDTGVRFLQFAHRNSVNILAGTDLGAPFVYPGRSLVAELELLTRYVG